MFSLYWSIRFKNHPQSRKNGDWNIVVEVSANRFGITAGRGFKYNSHRIYTKWQA